MINKKPSLDRRERGEGLLSSSFPGSFPPPWTRPRRTLLRRGGRMNDFSPGACIGLGRETAPKEWTKEIHMRFIVLLVMKPRLHIEYSTPSIAFTRFPTHLPPPGPPPCRSPPSPRQYRRRRTMRRIPWPPPGCSTTGDASSWDSPPPRAPTRTPPPLQE